MAQIANSGNNKIPQLGMVTHGKLVMLEDFLRQHFVYRSELQEVIRTIEFQMEWFRQYQTFEGDCDDIATLIAAMVKRMGGLVRFVAIQSEQGNPDFTHVYTEIWDGSRWFPIDPTVPSGTLYTEVGRMVHYV